MIVLMWEEGDSATSLFASPYRLVAVVGVVLVEVGAGHTVLLVGAGASSCSLGLLVHL